MRENRFTRSRVNQILDSIGTFNPQLNSRNFKLTDYIDYIPSDSVVDIDVQDHQSGQNGAYDSATASPTQGNYYRLVVETNTFDAGQIQHYTYSARANSTNQTDLTDQFVNQINDDDSSPFTASNQAPQLRVTEDPSVLGQIAGTVLISEVNIYDDNGVFLSFSTSTSHTTPFGEPELVNQEIQNDVDFRYSAHRPQVVGSVNSTSTYDTVRVTWKDIHGDFIQDKLFIDTTVNDYVKNVSEGYAYELGILDGQFSLVAESSASTTSTIPEGIKWVDLDQSSNNNFTLTEDLPIRTEIDVLTNAGVIEMPTDESLNGGTNAGTATVPSNDYILTLRKVASGNWVGTLHRRDGVAATSTTDDMPASS